jgi:hypothetical protein
MSDVPVIPEEYAAQQFHNVHMHNQSEYTRPEWYEMPHFAQGGAVSQIAHSNGNTIDRALSVIRSKTPHRR